MSINKLHHAWSRPDNAQLTAKQFSFRLPIHIAAKLQALCEMYPTRNRTQIVADLLDGAMDQLEAALPMEAGEVLKGRENARPGQRAYYATGLRAQFRERANNLYEIYEMERGIQQPGRLYQQLFVSDEELKEQGRD